MQIEVFTPKDKQKQMLELLKFDTVMVFIDARQANVKVPLGFKDQFDLRLNFDYEFGINDFRVLPDRIEASLSFAEGEFFCVIPFDAIYLILCQAVNRGCLFPESVPNEMLDFFFDAKSQHLPKGAKRPFKLVDAAPEETLEKSQPLKANKKTTAPKAKSVEAETLPSPRDETPTNPTETQPKKNHLRLVK